MPDKGNPKIRHGMANTSTHTSWRGAKQRCSTTAGQQLEGYVGRGITMCEEWQTSFLNFYRDMGPRPANTSLERRNNSKGYNKENCYWATSVEQNNNRRDNRRVTFNDKTQTLSQWAKETGISPRTIRARLYVYGWSVEAALTTPPNTTHKGHRLLSCNGETMKLIDWAKRVGLSDRTISDRLAAGWPVEKAILTPSCQGKRPTRNA